MDKERMTNEELTELNKSGEPLTGLPKYVPGASGFGLRDPKGNAIGQSWYSLETPIADVNDKNARIGDYVLQRGKAVVVPNSPTDLNLKTQIVTGATSEHPEYDFSIFDAIKSAGPGAIAGYQLGGGANPGGIAGAVIGSIGGLLNGWSNVADQAIKDWKKQEVEVSSPLEFYRDDEGNLKYKIDTQRMAEGGARSGSMVKDYQDRQVDVSLDDDNNLNIYVSPIFASTARYQELIDYIAENFAGLNKDTENLDKILSQIKDTIQSESDKFIGNSQLYADYATRFDADPVYLVAAYTDEAIGNTDPENMDKLDMVVLKDNGEMHTVVASKFFDSVKQMTLEQRGELIGKLTQIAMTAEGYEDYTENQRAIAYGELKALWAASENRNGYESKYAGMLNDEFFTSLLNSFSPLRINIGDTLDTVSNGSLGLKNRRWLKQDEMASTIGVLGGAYITTKGFQKLFGTAGSQGIIGDILKKMPGTSKIFEKSLEGMGGAKGELASTIKDLLANSASYKDFMKAGWYSFLFNTAKVGIYEAAVNGIRSGVSGTDFLKEFGEDFAIDMVINAVMQYYDTIRLTASIGDSKVYVYRDPTTGKLKKLDTYEPRIFEAGDGTPREETFTSVDANGKKQEFVRTGNGASVYEPVGSYNIRKTRSGDTVGAFELGDTAGVIVNGKVVTISPDGTAQTGYLGTGDIGLDEFPDLNNGVVNVDGAVKTADTVDEALKLAGLSKDTEVFEMNASDVKSAIVAGKLSKLDASKLMLKANTALFNRNAVLDAVNELALAKTGDRTAYLKRTEYFASDIQNATRSAGEIADGVYYKPAKNAFDTYDKLVAEANISKRWSKADSNYINAIGEIARAELLNKTRVKGDNTDYVASALETYKDDLAGVSQDRAALLDKIQEARIARNKAIVESARKSGKIDIKKLEKVTDTDIQDIGWVPIWGKKTTYNGLLDKFYGVEQEVDPYRGWLRDNHWVPADELMSPLQADSDFLSLISTNMGLNDKNEMTMEAFRDAGLLVDNTPSEKTIRDLKLKGVKNKDELKKKLDQMIKEKEKQIDKKALTPKQYKQRMIDLYEKYGIEDLILKAIDGERVPTAKTSEKVWDKWWSNATPGMRRKITRKITDSIPTTEKATDEDYPGFKVDEREDGNSGKLSMLDESNPNMSREGTARDYYRDWKGRELVVVEMAPGEYEKLMKRSGRGLNAAEKKRASYYTNKFKNGERVDIPYIDYDKDWKISGQEGRHRAVGAAQAGIEKIPVIIEYPKGSKIPSFLKKYKDVTDKFVIGSDSYFKQLDNLSYSDYARAAEIFNDQLSPSEVASIRKDILGIIKQEYTLKLMHKVEQLLNATNKYLQDFGYTTDIKTFMNTSAIPDIQKAINLRSKPGVAAVIQNAMIETTPYVPKASLKKDELAKVAEDWYNWAVDHIKVNRKNNTEIIKFAKEKGIEVPSGTAKFDVRFRKALWDMAESGKKLPEISEFSEIFNKKISEYADEASSLEASNVEKIDEALRKLKQSKIGIPKADAIAEAKTVVKNAGLSTDSELYKAMSNEEKALKEAGYAIIDITGMKYDEGMRRGNVEVVGYANGVEPKGEEVYITKTMSPMVFDKKGLIRGAKVELGTKDSIEKPKRKVKRELFDKSGINNLKKVFGVNVADNVSNNKLSKSEVKKIFNEALNETPIFKAGLRDKKELVDLVSMEINGETEDPYTMGVSNEATGMGGRYPIRMYKDGKPYTRFIRYDTPFNKRVAETTYHLQNDKQLIRQPGIVRRIAQQVSNDFRNLRTGWDPSRAPLNRARDLGRGFIASSGNNFWNPKKIIENEIEYGNFTPEQKIRLKQAIDRAVKLAQGARYNEAFKTPRKAATAITKRHLENSGANKLKVFSFNIRSDKRAILEWPMNFFENLTRKNLAESAAAVKLVQARNEGKDFKQTLEDVAAATEFAGKEYTANFGRKGALIGELAPLVAYLSSGFAGFDSLKKAYIADPKGVSTCFSLFLLIYAALLADALGDEKSRKNYYRLSDYDRSNSIVIALDSNSLLTIPMDQELASLLFPYRRIIETLNNVDPVSFWELIWGTFTEPIPFDLSGFSEGGYFNLKRGVEKLIAQNTPDIISGVAEAITGYDLYYGSDISVSADTLKDYGLYDPEPGDFTTTSKNSLTLRNIANAIGVPQWQLQALVSSYGGNVGQYVLYSLDKLSGATEDARGGKSFMDTMFNSLLGADKDTAQSMFYDGLKKLEADKNKLLQTIYDLNEKMKTATGDELYKYQSQLQKAKDNYATKVGDYVNQYLNAYEITGGLTSTQATQIYYLFRLDDDNTIYPSGSVEEYYHDKVLEQFKNQATEMSAPILDKYYNNRLGNIYQDSDGVWREYNTRSLQALKNSIYGESVRHKVGLLNILEGKDSQYSDLRSKISKARSAAYDAKDWDTRDALAYEQDKAVLQAIYPYVQKYGAENVINNSEVLDYLSKWIIVPDEFKVTKKGKSVSLGNGGSTQEAFVKPFIKYIFGLGTGYQDYDKAKVENTKLGEISK